MHHYLSPIILLNSSKLIFPSPFVSASRIMASNSSSVRVSFNEAMTFCSSSRSIKPLPSASNTLSYRWLVGGSYSVSLFLFQRSTHRNASLRSSASFSDLRFLTRPRNSWKSMVPLPSASTSLTFFVSPVLANGARAEQGERERTYHVLEFGITRVHAKRSQDDTKLASGDATIAILVEKLESLAVFSDLFICELIGLM